MAYINGIYTLSALNSAIGSAFSKRKISYMKEPLELEHAKTERSEKVKFDRGKMKFQDMMIRVNSKFKGEN